jgi:hypothetical protein
MVSNLLTIISLILVSELARIYTDYSNMRTVSIYVSSYTQGRFVNLLIVFPACNLLDYSQTTVALSSLKEKFAIIFSPILLATMSLSTQVRLKEQGVW